MLSRIAHSLIGTRLSIGSVRQVISERFDRRILAFGVIIIAAVTFQHYFVFGVNATPSLPHTLYLIHKGEPIRRGDLIAFRWAGGGPYIARRVCRRDPLPRRLNGICGKGPQLAWSEGRGCLERGTLNADRKANRKGAAIFNGLSHGASCKSRLRN